MGFDHNHEIELKQHIKEGEHYGIRYGVMLKSGHDRGYVAVLRDKEVIRRYYFAHGFQGLKVKSIRASQVIEDKEGIVDLIHKV